MNPFCVASDFWNAFSVFATSKPKVLTLTMKSAWNSLPELHAFLLPQISLRSARDEREGFPLRAK